MRSKTRVCGDPANRTTFICAPSASVVQKCRSLKRRVTLFLHKPRKAWCHAKSKTRVEIEDRILTSEEQRGSSSSEIGAKRKYFLNFLDSLIITARKFHSSNLIARSSSVLYSRLGWISSAKAKWVSCAKEVRTD